MWCCNCDHKDSKSVSFTSLSDKAPSIPSEQDSKLIPGKMGDKTEAAVLEYLKHNPGFTKEWFLKNVDKDFFAHD